ncbi:MAG TPA: hypothetical protein VFU06_01585, partial [Longimicrobiales bacterium]|nr:hypothetical protein [Longimicrobiales bacterium]
LPPAVIAAWQDRVQIVTVEEWRAQPPRVAATLISVGELRRAGPFVRLSIDQVSRHAREPHQAAGGWASGREYTLMLTQSGWVIVDTGGWIT